MLLVGFFAHSCYQSHLHVQNEEILPSNIDQKAPGGRGTLSEPIKNTSASLAYSDTNMGVGSKKYAPNSDTISRLTPRKRPAEALYHDTEEKKESPTALERLPTSQAISALPSQNVVQQNAAMAQEDIKKSTENGENREDLQRWFDAFVEAVDDEAVLYQGELSSAIPKLVQQGAEKGYLTKSKTLSIEVGWESDCIPLHYAAAKGNSQAVKALLDKDVPMDVQTPGSGTTPLQFAAHGGHVEVVGQLINAYKKRNKIREINAKDSEGTSTLQYTALGTQEDMNREVAKLLVEEGADLLEMDNDTSIMDMAAVSGNSAMVEYCMEEVFNKENEEAIVSSAMKIAGRKGHMHIVVMLQSRYDALKSKS